MPRSINVSIPVFMALLLLLGTPLLLFGSTYLFYKVIIEQPIAKGNWLAVNPILQEELFNMVVWQGVAIFIILIPVCLILYLVLRAAIFTPLRQLHKTILKIQHGDVNVKAEVKVKNEIGELAKAFNEMVENLQKYQAALQEAKQVLEIKVEARTKELKEIAARQEETIKARTMDLQAKINELERFRNLTIGRELKMIELKKKIANLQEKLSQTKVENK